MRRILTVVVASLCLGLVWGSGSAFAEQANTAASASTKRQLVWRRSSLARSAGSANRSASTRGTAVHVAERVAVPAEGQPQVEEIPPGIPEEEPVPELVEPGQEVVHAGLIEEAAGTCPSCGGLSPAGCPTCGPAACWSDPCWMFPPFLGAAVDYIIQGSQFDVGAHGFKGPADDGRNGNFGLGLGWNFGAPLGDPWGMGYQVGYRILFSNFEGDRVTTSLDRGSRNQYFLTAGLFHRKPTGGLQWGVVFDYLHDDYHGSADLQQLRTEVSLVWAGCRELGFWGAFATGGDRFEYNDTQDNPPTLVDIDPMDTYAFFFRRHYTSGAEGRLWAGFSGEGDGLIGADFTLPLAASWAVETGFTYLTPQDSDPAVAQRDESWNVMLRLVWYPGRPVEVSLADPFRPLLNVADNGTFLLNR